MLLATMTWNQRGSPSRTFSAIGPVRRQYAVEPQTVEGGINDMGNPLPDFASPPVVEVALSVQFEPLVDLRTPQMGLLWGEFREQFPRFEEHAPLDPVIERFGTAKPGKLGVKFETMTKPPLPRCWFLNEAGTELTQVQQDRFIHNWRKVGDGDEYPRYEHVSDKFRQELVTFDSFIQREEIGELIPNQCEITYVNHIGTGQEWQTHGQLGEVLTLLSGSYSEQFLPTPEDARLKVRFVIPGKNGQQIGRLHLSAEPGYWKSNNEPMFVVTLTARGQAEQGGIDGVMRFLDIGREWIVRGFAALTTPQMHKAWGRRDAS